MEEWHLYTLLALVGPLVGALNTLAIGGSLLTVPILIFRGLLATVATGPNRIALLKQGIANVSGYRSKGKSIAGPFILYLSIIATLGTLIGSKLAIDINENTFNKVLAIVMVLTVEIMLLQPRIRINDFEELISGKLQLWATVSFFFIGIYGGFIQAETGIYILLALSTINHLSLINPMSLKR